MRHARAESALTRDVREAILEDRVKALYNAPDQRLEQIREAGEFAAVYHDELEGRSRAYLSLLPEALDCQKQLELELPGYEQRAEVRRAVADYIEGRVFPIFKPRWLDLVPTRLRTARRSGCVGVRRDTGQRIVYWDVKAGLSRLCPDDAREEAQRLSRRVLEPLEAWQQKAGYALHYCVFTLPNFQPGKLRSGMQAIFERFKKLQKKFPQIEGALTVLEAPLGRCHDWNVHLNAILVVRGFLDWKALRKQWHYNVELRKLTGAPGSIGAALRELIKYAVAATPAKSEAKAAAAAVSLSGQDVQAPADGDQRQAATAPPFTAWPADRAAEWLDSMHAFRRTRTYGCLFRLPEPPPDIGPVVWLGRVELGADGRYRHRLALLDSIPEDKSHPGSPLTAYQQLCRRLLLYERPAWAGWQPPRMGDLT